jgi:hypothetical protein
MQANWKPHGESQLSTDSFRNCLSRNYLNDNAKFLPLIIYSLFNSFKNVFWAFQKCVRWKERKREKKSTQDVSRFWMLSLVLLVVQVLLMCVPSTWLLSHWTLCYFNETCPFCLLWLDSCIYLPGLFCIRIYPYAYI